MSSATLRLLQGGLVAGQERGELGRLLVARLAGLVGLAQARLDRLEVLDLELQVHDFLVADGIHGAVHVDDVAVVEAAQDVQDGVALADVGQELVAEALAAAGAAHQTGDVDDVDRGRDRALGLADLGKHLQALVRDVGGAEVGFDRAEREIGALRAS